LFHSYELYEYLLYSAEVYAYTHPIEDIHTGFKCI
jgi:hypothetical protein